MLRRAVVAALLLVAVALVSAGSSSAAPCAKLFTVAQARRAVDVIYGGTRNVPDKDVVMLRRIVRCQRNPAAVAYLHRYWAREIAEWKAAKFPPPLGPVTASWYDDSGTTGCGFHATYGIATFVVPCGGHVTLINQATGRAVVATRDDSGPYVGGRTFDLNPNVKAALGCGDLCTLMYR